MLAEGRYSSRCLFMCHTVCRASTGDGCCFFLSHGTSQNAAKNNKNKNKKSLSRPFLRSWILTPFHPSPARLLVRVPGSVSCASLLAAVSRAPAALWRSCLALVGFGCWRRGLPPWRQLRTRSPMASTPCWFRSPVLRWQTTCSLLHALDLALPCAQARIASAWVDLVQ